MSKPKKRSTTDKRGKHTKKDLEEKKQRLKFEYEMRQKSKPSCDECGSNEIGSTHEGDRLVCYECGFVLDNHINISNVPTEFVLQLSNKYLHRNYFSERIKQFQGLDPRFTNIQAIQITKVNEWLCEKYSDWPRSIYSFSKKHFGQICRILDILQPKGRWKQKVEKWLQGRDIIFGQDPAHVHDAHSVAYDLRVLFDPIAHAFATKFKSSKTHNIPKLDLVILILMYNINKETLAQYGWYFMNDDIYWETDAILKDYHRIKDILEWLNENFNDLVNPKPIRRDAKVWLKKRNYKIPEIRELKNIITSDIKSSILLDANLFFDFKINLNIN